MRDNELANLNKNFKVLTPVKNFEPLGDQYQKEDSNQHLMEQSEDSTYPSECSKSENEEPLVFVERHSVTSQNSNNNLNNSNGDTFFDIFGTQTNGI